MMKKLIIAIIGILIVSIGSAGLLQYYGKIVGNVNVQPPVFYASKDSISSNLYSLQINQKPQSEDTITITDGNSVYFITGEIGVTSFYKGNWHFYIKGKANSGSSTTLWLEFYVPQDATNYWVQKVKICEPISLSIGIDEKVYDVINTNCSRLSNLSPSDRFVWKITGPVNISITSNGETRIEVTLA